MSAKSKKKPDALPGASSVVSMPVADLLPYAANARTHSADQVKRIAASIKEFGFNNPILIDVGKGIIAGHGRLEAAKKLGLESVPVIELGHLSDAQKRAYILADNRLALDAGWDDAILAAELKRLQEDAFDVSLVGFSQEELDKLLGEAVAPTEGKTDEDEVPEDVPAIAQRGQVWKLGRHRLMCGDSTSAEAVARLMDGQKAEMVYTDPPYGMHLDADYKTGNGAGLYKGKDMSRASGVTHRNVAGDHDDFSPALIETVFTNFGEVPEVFMWGADYYAEHIPSRKAGSWVVWDKVTKADGEQSGVEKFHGSNFELCWSKAKHKRELARVMHKGLASVENDKRVHPTQKPVALAEWFFERWGQGRERIVDLFGGSGSTLIACEKTGRTCFMMELDEKYVDVIVARWEAFTGQKAELAE